ncbi:MAG: Rrf2 family transcriptional regulator [Rhodospirillaceae bacterium]|jgi:Rrf2 family protein|nr:Rrf2 family transcriptional regulator [Rhodospirillaceae bacterium]MBT5243841.1 Rrf2 family transcriptional regulator [Rhodospirillaceae bacterium]MBT5562890.1 Rrf2 family transcriptional regulator [Rhodospirillaceae bacterium]MBT6241289.1 Rrf2 family transcriptional regulator [Rhodospirillaceae bacterium]MBT7138748.1 Rrf2 family transcriptional regulator [Rhodospirillaceae bacterium]
MRLQKATQCALFAVLELAKDPGHQISAADIADKFGISANHLAKVMRDLARARLVESMRGAGGGYRFSGNAKRVTLYDIVNLFEDIDTHDAGFPQTGEEADIGLALNRVMTEIEEIAVSTLKSITLTTLLKQMERPSL